MEAGKRTIEVVFNKGRVLEIPFFQRSYVWEEENWERFLADMQSISKQDKDYFMGSLILKALPSSSAAEIGDQRIVVDGQQRLTTIVIFFKVLCDVKRLNDTFKDTFYNRSKAIILKHNHNDIAVFEAIVNGTVDEKIKKDFAENNILRAYEYFKRQEKALVDIDVNRLMNKLYFVGIDLSADEDEQQIFDTINSLGVSLTTAELLKNELFKRADERLYCKTWKITFEEDEDTREYWDQKSASGRQWRVNIDLLLQAFLLIKSEAKDKYIGLSSLFGNYKSFIRDSKSDPKVFIADLIEYADIYSLNIDPNLLNQDIDKSSREARLNVVVFGLNTTTILPYMLYVIKEAPSKEERDAIFKLLESYMIRRLICRETPKNYNQIFASLIRDKVNTFSTFKTIIYGFKDPSNWYPNDSAVQKGFRENNLSNQQAKVVLYLLEKSIRDVKYSTNLLPVNDYSLEHLMPKKWRNNWGAVSETIAIERDSALLKLGNLTIITAALNSSVRDSAWPIKKEGRNGKKGLNEYAGGIRIFDKYLKSEEWDVSSIEQRGNDLYTLAMDAWKF